jgi:hypothetical protein
MIADLHASHRAFKRRRHMAGPHPCRFLMNKLPIKPFSTLGTRPRCLTSDKFPSRSGSARRPAAAVSCRTMPTSLTSMYQGQASLRSETCARLSLSFQSYPLWIGLLSNHRGSFWRALQHYALNRRPERLATRYGPCGLPSYSIRKLSCCGNQLFYAITRTHACREDCSVCLTESIYRSANV